MPVFLKARVYCYSQIIFAYDCLQPVKQFIRLLQFVCFKKFEQCLNPITLSKIYSVKKVIKEFSNTSSQII